MWWSWQAFHTQCKQYGRETSGFMPVQSKKKNLLPYNNKAWQHLGIHCCEMSENFFVRTPNPRDKLHLTEVGKWWSTSTLLLYLSVFLRCLYFTWIFIFSNNFLLLLWIFEHKYLYFPLLTFIKQAHYFSFSDFAFLAELRTLYRPKCQ